jgi:hypothetical protein
LESGRLSEEVHPILFDQPSKNNAFSFYGAGIASVPFSIVLSFLLP